MNFTMKRFGTPKGSATYPLPEEIAANDFFDWLSRLDERAHGQRHTLPTGQACTYLHHDLYGTGSQYMQDAGRWFYLPPSSSSFTAYGFWLTNNGRHVFLAVYYGAQAEHVLLFPSTPLQLAVPPEGYKTPSDFEGAKITLISTVGARTGERIDSMLSDERSQSYIRIYAVQDKDTEKLAVEVGIPNVSHIVVNPPDAVFNQLFG